MAGGKRVLPPKTRRPPKQARRAGPSQPAPVDVLPIGSESSEENHQEQEEAPGPAQEQAAEAMGQAQGTQAARGAMGQSQGTQACITAVTHQLEAQAQQQPSLTNERSLHESSEQSDSSDGAVSDNSSGSVDSKALRSLQSKVPAGLTSQEMEIFSARAKLYIKEAQQPLYDSVLRGLARAEMHAIRDAVTIARAEARQAEKEENQKQLAEKTKEAARLQAEKDTLVQQMAGLQAEKDTLVQQMAGLQAEKDTMAQETETLRRAAATDDDVNLLAAIKCSCGQNPPTAEELNVLLKQLLMNRELYRMVF